MYFLYYELAKKCLDKYLKSAVSPYPSKSNMVKARKDFSNYDAGTFIILIDHRSGY